MSPQELQEFWIRENSIKHVLAEVQKLSTHFEDLGENAFILNAVILTPPNTHRNDEQIAEWVLTGAGSPNPADSNYTQSSRVMKAGITAMKREMQIIAAEMVLENREKIQKTNK